MDSIPSRKHVDAHWGMGESVVVSCPSLPALRTSEVRAPRVKSIATAGLGAPRATAPGLLVVNAK